nr:hypothetical protein [Tanacetum cinerariifolium]
MTVTITTEDMQKRRNDVKAKTTLLLALLDEHQLRFSKYETAQELWGAILKTFGGNEATNKTKKNQLKQQYSNFKAEGSETLEQTFNRLRAIVSHLEFMDVEIEQDDLNQKFLTSLAPKWLMYTIVWKNRDDLDTMSLDDVYNHLKVYEPKVQKKSDLNSQNMAFISSSNTSSGKGKVYTASVPTASTQVSTASTDIKYEDITHIDKDDIKEIDIKWNMALLSMREDRFCKKTGKKNTIQGSDVAGFDKSKVECFNCHKMGHFARECRAPRSQDRGKRESYRQGPKEEEQAPKALMAMDRIGWDWSYMANEEENHALVADKEVPTEFGLMAKSSSSSKNEVYDDSYCSKSCMKNTENLNTNISKLSEKLSDCETDLYHYKRGLSQVEARLVEFKTQEIKFCEKIRGLERDVKVRNNKIENLMNELEQVKKEKKGLDNKLTGFESASKDLDTLLGSQRTNKNKEGLGYNDVPPILLKSTHLLRKIRLGHDCLNLLMILNPPISKHGESSSSIMSKPMIKFVKAADYPGVIKTNKTKTTRKSPIKYVEMYRNTLKIPKVRGDQRKNWPKNNFAHKNVTPRVVLLKSGKTPIAVNRTNMNVAQQKMRSFAKIAHSNVRRPFQGKSAVRTQSCVPRVSTADLENKGKGNSQNNIDDKGYWDSGCSRHMTGNISYLTDVSQICDNKNSVLFTDSECIVLGKDFKLKDDTNAFADESMLWHRRLGHLNFKTMNKLVRNNLVEGLPSKCFKNDHTYVACLKGKQHKASCKTKLVNFMSKPLHTLYMDLFGPTSVSSLNHKWYCLVLTDDFSRPFGCHVMILNTLDHLGKLDAKGDEGYFVGYSMSSKAFRVFNKRTKKVEENLHVDFLENKLIEKGASPKWLFDIDTLTNSMNYVPVVVAGTSSTNISCTKDAVSQGVKKDVSSLRYIALPNWFHEAHMESSNSDAQDACNVDVSESSGISNPTATSKILVAEQMESLTVESEFPILLVTSLSYISFHIILLDHQRVTITLLSKVVDPTLGINKWFQSLDGIT